MKHKKLVIGCVVIIAIPLFLVVAGFIVGFCQGVAAHFPSKPTFFGIKLGDIYQCEYKYDATDPECLKHGAYDPECLEWIKNKYEKHERPYVFGGINIEKNVEAKIRRIADFYGQDMALLLVTRNTKKIIGVVVAANCDKKDVRQVAEEIKATVTRKHKNVTVVERVESWQSLAMAGFVRRPALDCIAVTLKPCKLDCANENFEMTIMGVNFKAVPAPIINGEDTTKSDLHLRSVASSAHFYYTASIVGSYVANTFIKWQVTPQTIEEMAEERELRKQQAKRQDIDLNAAYVYVLILLHDYVKYIDDDEARALLNEKFRQAEKRRKQEQVRRKNAAAL